jgi:hypothetical protein
MWCGISEKHHPAEVHGLGHMHADVPLGFVAPSDDLVLTRLESWQSDGLPIADVNDDGRAKTHLVRAKCRCRADAVCTPERVDGARCGACMQADAETATTSPDYDMREAR